MKRIFLSLGFVSVLWVFFILTVKADSTITIPVPEKAALDKKVTLSLKIPPSTEPVMTKKGPMKLVSRSSMVVWHSNPSPVMPVNDELHAIMDKYNEKGWIKTLGTQSILRTQPRKKYYMMGVLKHVTEKILDFAQSPNLVRSIRKANLSASDIEDLRRMNHRFYKELSMLGMNVKKVDRDLLMLQEHIKKSKTGILQVIRVEGTEDGGTVIHLNVD